tara:strand:+ start:385 stop:906 length:522 start_codon:yes stop_codon:yes gene_type:complete
MIENKFKKGRKGRPPKLESERRKRINCISLRDDELEILRNRYSSSGSPLPFGVYLRNKLLLVDSHNLTVPMDAEISKQLSDLLKLAVSFTLLAHRTKGDLSISQDFVDMSKMVRSIVNRVHYNINEVNLVHGIIPKIYPTLLSFVEVVPDEVAGELDEILKILEPHYERYNQV